MNSTWCALNPRGCVRFNPEIVAVCCTASRESADLSALIAHTVADISATCASYIYQEEIDVLNATAHQYKSVDTLKRLYTGYDN
jgi:hypothetical protein